MTAPKAGSNSPPNATSSKKSPQWRIPHPKREERGVDSPDWMVLFSVGVCCGEEDLKKGGWVRWIVGVLGLGRRGGGGVGVGICRTMMRATIFRRPSLTPLWEPFPPRSCCPSSQRFWADTAPDWSRLMGYISDFMYRRQRELIRCRMTLRIPWRDSLLARVGRVWTVWIKRDCGFPLGFALRWRYP